MYSRPHRYSLPVNFQAVVMKPNKKAQKRLTDTLNQLYGHLDSRYIESEAEVSAGHCHWPGRLFPVVSSMP